MRRALITALALLPAACAHQREEVREHHEPKPVVVEVQKQEMRAAQATPAAEPRPMVRPDAAIARLQRYGRRTMASDAVVDVPVPEGGLTYEDLFSFVAQQTGYRIRYESNSAVVKSKKIQMIGPTRVAKSDLLAWFQDTCVFDGLVALEQGPADRRELAVMDQANAGVSQRAVSVDEDELPALAGRCGIYVSSVLTVPEGLDPSRVRNALSQLATNTAGLGRVNDVDKTASIVLVADFANVVANMRRMLDEMAVALYEQQLR